MIDYFFIILLSQAQNILAIVLLFRRAPLDVILEKDVSINIQTDDSLNFIVWVFA